MMPAIFDQTTIDVAAGEKYTFRAVGSVLKFNGFLAVYEEGKDEKDEEDDERAAKLPKVEKGEQLKLNSLTPNQHFTEPPPRYTEATLVKALEEKGILVGSELYFITPIHFVGLRFVSSFKDSSRDRRPYRPFGVRANTMNA